MADISAADVKALRELTDLPMMKCKEALTEAGGDREKAIEILKKEFSKVQEKRKDNLTAEGQVFIAVKDDGSEAAMVEIQCESAPVATGEHLTKLGTQMVQTLLDNPSINSVEELLAQKASGSDKTFQTMYEDMVSTIREKIVVSRVTRTQGPVGGYVHHNKKLGVLFTASGGKAGNDPILRDVAIHIAALRPTVVRPEELESSKVQAERDRLKTEAKASGKPDNIIEKMVDGKMKMFYIEQGVLLLQPFAKDEAKTVEQALSEKGFKAESFTRWVIGN